MEAYVKEYLQTSNVLQLATSKDDQPWACNVHFYADDDLNIYWISTPERRHSLEIAKNPKVAAVIKIHENTSEEDYVIGLSLEGTAERIGAEIGAAIVDAYGTKHNKKPEMIADLKADKAPYKFYKLTPKSFVIFDTKNFKDNSRREWKAGN